MNLRIRNPRAHELAKELAARRNLSLTDAVIEALERELRRGSGLAERLAALGGDLRKKGGESGRDMSKDEIDAMWGH
ncbi:MAG TPA: type II toxin-antitoxin system VapB family antitoxin [Mesorhizobium sp.]|jgi:antitoxin VapB